MAKVELGQKHSGAIKPELVKDKVEQQKTYTEEELIKEVNLRVREKELDLQYKYKKYREFDKYLSDVAPAMLTFKTDSVKKIAVKHGLTISLMDALFGAVTFVKLYGDQVKHFTASDIAFMNSSTKAYMLTNLKALAKKGYIESQGKVINERLFSVTYEGMKVFNKVDNDVVARFRKALKFIEEKYSLFK